MKSALAAIFIGYSGLAAVSVVGLCCLFGQDVFQFSRGQEFRCDIAAVRFPLVFCHTDNQPVPDVSVFTGLEPSDQLGRRGCIGVIFNSVRIIICRESGFVLSELNRCQQVAKSQGSLIVGFLAMCFPGFSLLPQPTLTRLLRRSTREILLKRDLQHHCIEGGVARFLI